MLRRCLAVLLFSYSQFSINAPAQSRYDVIPGSVIASKSVDEFTEVMKAWLERNYKREEIFDVNFYGRLSEDLKNKALLRKSFIEAMNKSLKEKGLPEIDADKARVKVEGQNSFGGTAFMGLSIDQASHRFCFPCMYGNGWGNTPRWGIVPNVANKKPDSSTGPFVPPTDLQHPL